MVGIITEFDLLDLVWDLESAKNKVFHYMTRSVRTVDEDDELDAVAEIFRKLPVRRLLVVRDGRVVVLISRRDIIRHVLKLRCQISAPIGVIE